MARRHFGQGPLDSAGLCGLAACGARLPPPDLALLLLLAESTPTVSVAGNILHWHSGPGRQPQPRHDAPCDMAQQTPGFPVPVPVPMKISFASVGVAAFSGIGAPPRFGDSALG
jgi:hypothetical protein